MRRNHFLFFLMPLLLLISGCGSPGGGSVYFETVEVSATCKVTSLDSDVAFWEDWDGDGICEHIEFLPDSVEVIIRSKTLPNQSNIEIYPSDVRIEKVRIDYTPIDDSPRLPSRYLALGQFVEPDMEEEFTLEIMIVDQKQKSTSPLEDLICPLHSNCKTPYKYFVELTFSGVEVMTKKQENFSTSLTLQVSDFMTDGEKCD